MRKQRTATVHQYVSCFTENSQNTYADNKKKQKPHHKIVKEKQVVAIDQSGETPSTEVTYKYDLRLRQPHHAVKFKILLKMPITRADETLSANNPLRPTTKIF